jgi:flagellin-like protein
MCWMGLIKTKCLLQKDDEGDVGIGTLIIFIAIVLVAAIAASLILYAAALLQQQAQKTVDEAVSEVSGGLCIVNIAGDRNPDGADSTIVTGFMPSADVTAPSGGILWNVTATSDGASPLGIVLNWSSASDYGSGLVEEAIDRTSIYDPTNPDWFNEQVARNRLLTLSQLNSTYELVTVTSGFGPSQSYTDYTVRDDNSTSYAYAIVGVDNAGNRVLYMAVDSSSSTDDTTLDEDQVSPVGGSMTSWASTDSYSVMLFWVPPTDAGSGVISQTLYRAAATISAPAAQVVDGRTVLTLPEAVLIDVFNSTTSSYIDSPPAPGTYSYFIVAEDRSGNQVYLGSLTCTMATADTAAPSAVSNLGAHQAPLSVGLTWTAASDAQTSVDKYLVFRSTGVSALDSVEELRALTPLAILDASELEYYDYTGESSQQYYYTVVAVDIAGNYAQPVCASNTIQMIEIKVKTVPGSVPILFETLVIEITDGETDVTLSYNSFLRGPAGADATQFSVDVLRDPDGVFDATASLASGALVKIFIDAGEIGLNLHAQSSFTMKIIPTVGQPTLEICTIPYIGSYRYVTFI